MFDSVKFGIGVVTSEAFESLDSPLVKYCYAWKYNDEPTTEKEEKEVSDDLMKAINKEVSLEEFCSALSQSGNHIYLMIWEATAQ